MRQVRQENSEVAMSQELVIRVVPAVLLVILVIGVVVVPDRLTSRLLDILLSLSLLWLAAVVVFA